MNSGGNGDEWQNDWPNSRREHFPNNYYYNIGELLDAISPVVPLFSLKGFY